MVEVISLADFDTIAVSTLRKQIAEFGISQPWLYDGV